MKSFSDDLACIGNQNKCFGFVFFDEVAELYSLRTIQRSKDDVFVISGKCALCLADCGAPVQFMGQKITDRFRVVADNVEILGKVETFDERVDHKRTDRKPEERIKPSFDIEDKTSGDRDQNIGDEKRLLISKLEYFFRIIAMMSVPPLEDPILNRTAEPSDGSAIAKQSSSIG